MFSKKFLSIVTLLFFGSQLSLVSAGCTFTSLDTCACESSCTNVGYYAVFQSNPEGSFYTNVDTGDQNNGKLVYVSQIGGSCVCDTIGNSKIGYFKSPDGTYISNNYDEEAIVLPDNGSSPKNTVTSASDCGSDIGNLIKYDGKVYLCLSEDKSVELKDTGTGEHYLMDKAEGNIFTEDSTAKYVNIAIKDDDGALTFDASYNDEEYCVYSSNLVMSRVDNFCTSSILDNLYSCTDGLCEKSSSPIGKGNYVVEVSTGNFNLFLCDYDSGSSGPVTCVKDTEGTLNGLIVVQDTDNEDNYKVIKSISKTELVAITDISKVGDLFLYDCENGVCQRTDGFVKYGESLANTASCSTGSKCAVAAADLTITGIAVIDYTDFKFYDISDTSKETVKYTVAVNKEYFYKKDNNNFVLIKTANDGESSLMIIGVAKFIGSSVIADTVSFEVVASCQQSTQTTYTISGSITDSVACVITNPCDLASVDAQYCAEKGYYLRKGDGDLADSGSATGTLYYCSTATTCGVAPSVGIGLYKNADTITTGRPEYIKCSGSSSGCTAVAVKEVANDNDCFTSGVVIGDIIKFTSIDQTPVTTYKLCLTGTTTAKTVLLSSSDSAPTDIGSRFFIEISNNNAFGNENEKFVLIEVNSDGSILKNGAKTIKYRYTNADFKVRYRNDKSDVCNNNGTANEGIVEFALDGDNDYYIKKTSN